MSKKRFARLYDTPKAGPVRITNTVTGETRTEPPLDGTARKALSRSRRRNEDLIAFEKYRERKPY